MTAELPSRYSHKETEARWQELWEKYGAFSPEFASRTGILQTGDPYCIVIPPPNVTGQLHVGHALNNTIQDVLIRTARKMGRPTLWVPGVDHAGIATQARVEKELKEKEGLTRHELGREEFLKRVWDWKHHYGNVITKQIRRLGFSVDWSRERFTMDEGLSRAVRKVFVDLYKEGLIYRDTRMVNWDPEARTVLSDLEVEYEDGYKGELWSFAYPLTDGSGEIVVATTRPETLLGDTAIAVHPDDVRYKHLIGKTCKLPFVNREVPIIADSILVNPEFGTGAVKVTPAHDPNDFEVGKRHNLQFITIFDASARINENGGEFAGLDRYEARKAIKAKIAELGLERGSKENIMSIGRSQRSGVVVEPMISTQWFVRVRPLAEKAIEAVETGRIRFVPEQWKNLFYSWMRDIRDWCISRQLWWGHQIPAWHCADCGHITVSMEDVTACEHCQSDNITQDEDVLDTWFSSGLWPFSTLGWPESTRDLRTWYPNTVLVTAYDIIFFWVARMIMLGLHFMKDVPFRDVYIHGLMRDEKGRKISKSLGNNIDPIDVVNEFGADAYRFFLMATLTEGKDSTYSEGRLRGYQNFANKVWNSSRFVFMNLPAGFRPVAGTKALTALSLETEDLWILKQLNHLLETLNRTIGNYKFHIATEELYAFIWNQFCDWYIELIKPRLYQYEKEMTPSKEAALQTAFYVLRCILNVLHPFMPHITEEISAIQKQYLDNERQNGKAGPSVPKIDHQSGEEDNTPRFLMWEPWPEAVSLSQSQLTEASVLEVLQEVITKARLIRAEAGLAPDRKIRIIIKTTSAELERVIQVKEKAILRLAQAESIEVTKSHNAGRFESMEAFSEGEVFVPLEGLLDVAKEKDRLSREIAKISQLAEGARKKLSNAQFMESAPADVIEKEKQKLEEAEEKLNSLKRGMERLAKMG